MKKLNANTVGVAAYSDPLNQKGITLIALIITIIVMLILVGVTINVALNGGLFDKAETATRQTEEQAILEEMLAMMEIDDNGKFDYETIIEKMDLKYGVEYTYPNATITGKLGEYKYIVSETEIKIGSKEIKTFDWEDVGLTVDTDVDYRFYDTRFNTKYIINFTTDGKLIVKADGVIIETYDATDAKNINSDGNVMIPFTYAGTTYDTTLIMNTNNIDVDANLQGLDTVTYVKIEDKEYPVAYEFKLLNCMYVETDVDEMVLYDRENGVLAKYKIEKCNDIFKLKLKKAFKRIENNAGMNLQYSKAIIDENDYFSELVYFEEIDKWCYLKSNETAEDGEIVDLYYSIESNMFCERIELSQEEKDNILQSASNL